MKLSDILMPIPTNEQLSDKFPSGRKRGSRPRINRRDLQIFSLWLKGYTATAIAKDINVSTEAVASVVRVTKIHLRQAHVEIDIARAAPLIEEYPLTSSDPDVQNTITLLSLQEQLRKAEKHQHNFAVYIFKCPGLKDVLCKKLQSMNLCTSKELCPSQKKDACIKCIIKNSDYLVK